MLPTQRPSPKPTGSAAQAISRDNDAQSFAKPEESHARFGKRSEALHSESHSSFRPKSFFEKPAAQLAFRRELLRTKKCPCDDPLASLSLVQATCIPRCPSPRRAQYPRLRSGLKQLCGRVAA